MKKNLKNDEAQKTRVWDRLPPLYKHFANNCFLIPKKKKRIGFQESGKVNYVKNLSCLILMDVMFVMNLKKKKLEKLSIRGTNRLPDKICQGKLHPKLPYFIPNMYFLKNWTTEKKSRFQDRT